MKPILLFIFLFLNSFLYLNAQKIDYNIKFNNFIDNREYAKTGYFSQTMLGTRIAPSLIVKFDTISSLVAGTNILHEFCNSVKGKFDWTVYYKANLKKYDIYLGAFPRKNLIDDYPLAFLKDTLNYYKPNIEGALITYKGKKSRQTLWLDWISERTKVDRETFIAGTKGIVNFNKFYIKNYAYLLHDTPPFVEDENSHTKDNAAGYVSFGYNNKNIPFLDDLSIEIGPTMSLYRVRGLTDWETSTGLLSQLHITYKKFYLSNTFYAGKGMKLVYGDFFYKSKLYNRVDIGWKLINCKGVNGELIFSQHFVNNAIGSQQAFKLWYNFGG